MILYYATNPVSHSTLEVMGMQPLRALLCWQPSSRAILFAFALAIAIGACAGKAAAINASTVGVARVRTETPSMETGIITEPAIASPRAQAKKCTFDSYENRGIFTYHQCAGGCDEDWCETDRCACASSSGYIRYCVGFMYCGQYPGCYSCI